MMSSVAPTGKKPALCRYFLSSGECFYGEECQFLHEGPIPGVAGLSRMPNINDQGNGLEEIGIVGVRSSDGRNGDQYFTATFGGGGSGSGAAAPSQPPPPPPPPTSNPPPPPPPNIANGGPSFQPFYSRTSKSAQMSKNHSNNSVKRGKPVMRNGPMLGPGEERKIAYDSHSPSLPDEPNQEQFAIQEQFSGLAISSHQRAQMQPGTKGRNPAATTFVPKASTPQAASIAHNANTPQNAALGLTHSASTPSFTSYNSFNSSGLAPNTPSPQAFSQAFPAGTSPITSPGLSPQGSPRSQRRNKSPNTSLPPPPASSTPPIGHTMQVGDVQLSLQENVGGTTYFYTQDEMAVQQQNSVVMPNFTMYPGLLPHVAHMKPKANLPSFFMPDEIKLENLNRHAVIMAQVDPEHNPDLPQEVDNYHCLVPLEPPPSNPLQKSSTFGYQTSVYKATNTKDGLVYCLRRIHGFRLVNTKCMALIDLWKKIQHSNIVHLREVFTTKAFGDHSMVFVYDFHPGSETLMMRHFLGPTGRVNGLNAAPFMDGSRPYSSSKNPTKGSGGAARSPPPLLQESVIWSYIVQLSSALRTIHAHSLACRVMDPTKVLLTDKSSRLKFGSKTRIQVTEDLTAQYSRLRLNCLGIFDVLSFDANQSNPLAMMPHYQQEDLLSLGKVVLALACNSVVGIQREHIQSSIDLVSRNYSSDLKNLILYLLTNQNRMKSTNDIMPMIGARFYTQLDASQLRNDVLENGLAQEVENGRLFRLMSKLGTINERPEHHMDPTWSETGDRYMLKLFRDYLFHQVDEGSSPWIDLAHIVHCLNKLDAGVPEKLCLMSRDEQSVLVVTYGELKQCFETAFAELTQPSPQVAFS